MKPSLAWAIGSRYGRSGRGGQSVGFLSRVSVLGLVLAVALLLLVLSVMNGFERELRTRILSLVAHATIEQPGGLRDWQAVVQAAEENPRVVAAAPFVHLQGMLVRGNKVAGVLLYAVLPERERRLSIVESFMEEGGELAALERQDNGVIISRRIADQLGARVGDKLAFLMPAAEGDNRGAGLQRVVIAGIYRSNTELDNVLGYAHLRLGQRMLGLGDAVQGVELRVSDLMAANAVAREIAWELDPYYVVRDWTVSHGNLAQAIALSRQLVMMMLVIIVAVAAFNVVTALMMVVNDKRSDIAILQTMGMVPATIRRVFLVQGLIIGVAGTLAGALLGVLLSWNVTDLVAWLEGAIGYQFLKSDIYPVTYLPAEIRPLDVAAVCGAALAFSVLASVYPAWRATRILPADALRYDK